MLRLVMLMIKRIKSRVEFIPYIWMSQAIRFTNIPDEYTMDKLPGPWYITYKRTGRSVTPIGGCWNDKTT